MRNWLAFALIGVCMAFSALKPAEAATINLTVNFGASTFSGAPPVGFVLGQFHLSLDPSADATGAATTDFLNLATGPVGFDYNKSIDTLIIGSTLNTVGAIVPDTDDFFLAISSLSTTPVFTFFGYTQTANAGAFTSTNGAVHVTRSPSPQRQRRPRPHAPHRWSR